MSITKQQSKKYTHKKGGVGESMIIKFIRWLLGIHPPIQLRNATAPSDWRQTVAETIDREQPWLKYRY